MEGHDKSEAKQAAFAQIPPVFQKELADVYMDNLARMKALKRIPSIKISWRPEMINVDNDMFDQDEAIAAAVDKRKFLFKRLLENRGRFPEQ